MIEFMDMGKNIILLRVCIRGILCMIKNKEKVNYFFWMVLIIKEILIIIILKVMALKIIKMDQLMKDNGLKIKNQEMEFLNGQMEEFMKVNF